MKKNLSVKRILLLNVIIVFIIAIPLHYLYTWTNSNIIGAFSPINESVWEHSKLVLYPLILVNIIEYLIFRKIHEININKYFISLVLNIIISILLLFLLYYFIRYGLNIDNMIVDISLLPISLLIGALIQSHYYKYGREINLVSSICIIVFIIFIYILFTFSPPNLPLFLEI